MKQYKYIYVCSPYGGQAVNYEAARSYGRYVLATGAIPIIPHTMLHGIADDKNPEHRQAALELGRMLLKSCDEVWVFGSAETATDGMTGEILLAGNTGKPIKYINPGEVMNRDDRAAAIRQCVIEYEKRYLSIGRLTADSMISFIDAGMDADLIIEAVDRAYKKGAAWNYAKTILNACRAKGIRTLEQYLDSNKKKKKPGDFAGFDLDAFERRLNSD